MPVEVQSSKLVASPTLESSARKRTKWLFHVPSHLQHKVDLDLDNSNAAGQWTSIGSENAKDLDELEADAQDEVEYQVSCSPAILP